MGGRSKGWIYLSVVFGEIPNENTCHTYDVNVNHPILWSFFVQINWSFGFFTQWHLGGKVQLPTRFHNNVSWTQATGDILSHGFLQMLLYGGRRSHLKQLYLETTTMFFFDSDLFSIDIRLGSWNCVASFSSNLTPTPEVRKPILGLKEIPTNVWIGWVKPTCSWGTPYRNWWEGSHLPPDYPGWKGVDDVAISQLPRNLRLCKGPSSDTSDFFFLQLHI